MDRSGDFVDPSVLMSQEMLDATAAEEEIKLEGSSQLSPRDASAGAAYTVEPGLPGAAPATQVGVARTPAEAARPDATAAEQRIGTAAADEPEQQPVQEEPLPYGGDVQAAMQAHDRDAIRKIFAARQAAEIKNDSPAPTTPPGEPHSLHEAELQMESMRMESMRSSQYSPIGSAHGNGMGIDATAVESSSEMISTTHLNSVHENELQGSRLVSPDPDVSYGVPFPYAVEEIDGRTVGAHSMPAGGQHGLGLQYIRGRLLRMAPPPAEKFANENSLCRWNALQFWCELVLQLLVGLTGPVGWLLTTLVCGKRGAQSRGFIPGRQGGRYTNVAFFVSLVAWLIALPLLDAALKLMRGDAPDYDIDTIAEILIPLLLLVLYYVVIAVKYAFISPKELAWRRQNRRDSSYLTDELYFSWLFKRSERAMQWELDLADWRAGGGLDAASLEYLPEQPPEEPLAAEELKSMLGSTAPEPEERPNGLSKRAAHGRWAGPDAPAAMQRPFGVPLRTVLQRALRYGAAQRTGKMVAVLTALTVITAAAVHAGAPHVIRANTNAHVGSFTTPPMLVASSIAVSSTAMAMHVGHLMCAVHELRRRQLVLDIFAHMMSLTGHRHPSSTVTRFPLLVQDSTHNVHTWIFGLQLMHGTGVQYRLRMQIWGGIYAVGLLAALVAIWHRLLFMHNGDQLPVSLVALSVDAVILSPFVFALCSVASTLNYTAQHQLGAFTRARRRALYELAELEEAQAEAAERWHQGAARQLRQLERALGSAAAELRDGAAGGRGLIELLGLQAGDMLTLFGLAAFLCSVGGALGLAYTAGQPISDTNDAVPVPLLNASDMEHSHTCVCEWPGFEKAGDDSLSDSGSWANSTA